MRVLSLDPKTPFVFWNLVLPTLSFRDILDLVGLWRKFLGLDAKLEMDITRFVFEIEGWVSFHFVDNTAAHRVVPGLRGFSPV